MCCGGKFCLGIGHCYRMNIKDEYIFNAKICSLTKTVVISERLQARALFNKIVCVHGGGGSVSSQCV